jgi:hypothetical protein
MGRNRRALARGERQQRRALSARGHDPAHRADHPAQILSFIAEKVLGLPKSY